MDDDSKYDVLEEIGRGSFGIIRRVRRKSDGYILCRKEISYKRMSPKEREQLQAELSILKDLRHPNIVAYYERTHCKETQSLHMYMEYCGNGDLSRVIEQHRIQNTFADESFVWSMLAQLVTALYRCHYGENPPQTGRSFLGGSPHAAPLRAQQGKVMILHRDLKPDNVFLGADNSVKLGDFGLSKILQSHDFASTYVGTPFYMSPEICAAERYTLRSDIWSLGCIIHELCAREPPFNAKTHLELIQKIKAGKFAPLPKIYSPELGRVVSLCLNINPLRRPDTAELLNLAPIKIMRKELEIVELGNDLRVKIEEADRKANEADRKIKEANAKAARLEDDKKVLHHNIDMALHREWEVRAQLTINEHRQKETDRLAGQFESAVESAVQERLEKEVQARLTQLQRQGLIREPAKTPTKAASDLQPSLESSPKLDNAHQPAKSFSTVGEASEFPSQTDVTDLSSLSTSPPATSSDVPVKRTRTPFDRAKTINIVNTPADVDMPDPSPMSIACLSLSPRRASKGHGPLGQARPNIFADAGKPRWEPMVPDSSDDEDAGVLGNDESEDEEPASPTLRRGGLQRLDPMKRAAPTRRERPGLARQQTMPARPRGAQNIFATAGKSATADSKAKVQNAVPVVATSPTRQRTKLAGINEQRSPVSKGNLFGNPNHVDRSNEPGGGLKSKKGNMELLHKMEERIKENIPPTRKGQENMLRAATTRNQALVQGRTLVQLQQARSGYESKPPPVWDDAEEMPSPFLRRTRSKTVQANASW